MEPITTCIAISIVGRFAILGVASAFWDREPTKAAAPQVSETTEAATLQTSETPKSVVLQVGETIGSAALSAGGALTHVGGIVTTRACSAITGAAKWWPY